MQFLVEFHASAIVVYVCNRFFRHSLVKDGLIVQLSHYIPIMRCMPMRKYYAVYSTSNMT